MMLKSVERDQLDREVVEMRDMRRSRLLTCALSAVVAGILVVPATALAVGEAGTVTDDVEMTEPVSTDSQNEADNEPITVGEEGQYTTILEALQETDTDGTDSQTRTVKLVGNITNGPGFSVFEHDTLTIDLNGHTLTLSDTANISVAGNLTVVDGNAGGQNPQVDEESGSVTYGVQGAIVLGGSSTVSATGSSACLKLDSGTVRSSAHGCVRVATGATFEMTGGLIDSTDGFAVEVNDEGSFKMTGGVAKATNYSAVMGDDNFRRGDTRIQINGGYILSVSNDEPVGAGVCQVMDGGILQMDSGTIRAVGKGVGVIVEYGSFRLNGGEIYGDGMGFAGQTAGRVPVDNGYGLVLYSAAAGTEINGGFISGMKAEDGTYPVPSVNIADAVSTYGVSTMSLDLAPVDQGVSIKGGTYTNFAGLEGYVENGYDELGHSAAGRSFWVTVMERVTESEVESGESVNDSPITGKTAYVFKGQMDYYRGNLKKSEVEYLIANEEGNLEEELVEVYQDYPVYGKDYVFSGWFMDSEATQAKRPEENDMVGDDTTSGVAFAKLSDADLMHVVFNTSSNLWDGDLTNDDTAQMTAYALADSASFDVVGLRTQFGNGEEYPNYKQYRALARMPYSLTYVDQDNNKKTQHAYNLNPVATFIGGIRISDLSTKSNLDDRYFAYQWWITKDGTHVEGPWYNMSIATYLKNNYPNNDLEVK